MTLFFFFFFFKFKLFIRSVLYIQTTRGAYNKYSYKKHSDGSSDRLMLEIRLYMSNYHYRA